MIKSFISTSEYKRRIILNKEIGFASSNIEIDGAIIIRSSGVVVSMDIFDFERALNSFIDLMENQTHCTGSEMSFVCSLCLEEVKREASQVPIDIMSVKRKLAPFVSCRNYSKNLNFKIILSFIFAFKKEA